MDIPVRPGDALSQPTRARVFALLGELRRPAGTEELAKELDLHPNGVRVHLEQLVAAGLVERRPERIARGRPRDTWAISPNAQPGGDPPSGYAALERGSTTWRRPGADSDVTWRATTAARNPVSGGCLT